MAVYVFVCHVDSCSFGRIVEADELAQSGWCGFEYLLFVKLASVCFGIV